MSSHRPLAIRKAISNHSAAAVVSVLRASAVLDFESISGDFYWEDTYQRTARAIDIKLEVSVPSDISLHCVFNN